MTWQPGRAVTLMLGCVVTVGAIGTALDTAAAKEPPPPRQQYTLHIDQPLRCAFCNFGLEYQLESVDGVDEATVDRKTRRAHFEVDGRVVMPAQVVDAVGRSGVALGTMELEARGIIHGAGIDFALALDPDHRLRLGDGSDFPRLQELKEAGERDLVLGGELEQSDEYGYVLQVETIRLGDEEAK